MNDAIAAHRLPGAVVVVGHGGKVVFHLAYGSRKLAGEPGLDGSPALAEPTLKVLIVDGSSPVSRPTNVCIAGYPYGMHDLPNSVVLQRSSRV